MKTDKEIKEAVIYCRVSSSRQEKEGYSIPAQEKLLMDYAQKNNIKVVEIFREAESAKESGRKQFNEMVKFFKKENEKNGEKRCRSILVEKEDRLTRNFRDIVTLDELDLDLYFVKENTCISKNSSSQQKLIYGFKVLLAKNYSDNLREETQKGMLEKARQGYYPSAAPIGYKNVNIDGKKEIIVDEKNRSFIERLFELYATGNYSIQEVTKIVHSEGLGIRKGGSKITRSRVHCILKSPIYYGCFYWGGILFKGNHEPIISKELFDRVQEVITGKSKPRKCKHDFTFKGLLKCGHCGSRMVGYIAKGKYIYYHCSRSKANCNERYISEAEMDKHFLEDLKYFKMDESLIKWVKEALIESHKDEKDYRNKCLENLEREKNDLRRKLDIAYEDRVNGYLSVDDYFRKSNEWKARQIEIEESIRKLDKADNHFFKNGIMILELVQNIVPIYSRLSFKEKRNLLNLVYSNCLFKDGKLIPQYRQPFDILIDMNKQEMKKKCKESGKEVDFEQIRPRLDSNQRHDG